MSLRYAALLLAGTLAFTAAPALAVSLDAPTVQSVAIGHGKVALQVTAGASGAPNGFAVYWMTLADYDDYGSFWPENISFPGLGWANFTGTPTLNTNDGVRLTTTIQHFYLLTVRTTGNHPFPNFLNAWIV